MIVWRIRRKPKCKHVWSSWCRAGVLDSTERRDCKLCKRIETRDGLANVVDQSQLRSAWLESRRAPWHRQGGAKARKVVLLKKGWVAKFQRRRRLNNGYNFEFQLPINFWPGHRVLNSIRLKLPQL